MAGERASTADLVLTLPHPAPDSHASANRHDHTDHGMDIDLRESSPRLRGSTLGAKLARLWSVRILALAGAVPSVVRIHRTDLREWHQDRQRGLR